MTADKVINDASQYPRQIYIPNVIYSSTSIADFEVDTLDCRK